jgi:hypothetical protein
MLDQKTSCSLSRAEANPQPSPRLLLEALPGHLTCRQPGVTHD